jgi:hypothetical protein
VELQQQTLSQIQLREECKNTHMKHDNDNTARPTAGYDSADYVLL